MSSKTLVADQENTELPVSEMNPSEIAMLLQTVLTDAMLSVLEIGAGDADAATKLLALMRELDKAKKPLKQQCIKLIAQGATQIADSV